MPSRESVSSSMRYPACCLAFLRIVVGIRFLKSLFTKVTLTMAWGFLPLPAASGRWIATMPKLLAKYAAENPFPAYKAFLLDTVVANPQIWAHLTALGEVAVGLSLTFGFLTVLGVLFGLVQVAAYGFATQHLSSGQQGFHIMLFAMMIAFLIARAGRVWGVDGWVRRHAPNSFLARVPLG